MSISNRERIGRALESLQTGLYPFVIREMQATYGDKWLTQAIGSLPDSYTNSKKSIETILKEDISALLIVMWEHWNNVFKQTLARSDRSIVSELRETRNAWAHNDSFTTDDSYRAFDSIARLLTAVSADTSEVEKQKQEILRLRFDAQAKKETRRSAIAPTEGQPMSGLKPWREIATPHPDVATGRYQQAEFAADLWEVYLDRGSEEYRQPTEFFRRTYLTEGIKQLLINALIRLSGLGGDPVIELQTNFGGGKTHTMLSLYHLCSGISAENLPGLEIVFQEAGVKEPPANINTAVIVGNKISPGQTTTKKDGTKVRTIWGEIAWQLGGREAYEMLREADETATNPGDVMKELFNRYSPCLILIDEWVSYARQLHDKADLPGGSFDTHFTFVQTLSESAKNAKNTLLVVSIPASDMEIGGDRGKEALERIKNAIGRVESPWRPASAEESFEIVRRRLFETTTDPALFVARDAVIKAFSEMYRVQAAEFPTDCREAKYERRLQETYPIHPELFDRLYTDWSTLDKFQRTRGVLRLMAKVIHSLWERDDKSLLIMPAQIPIDDPQVQSELTRYLDDNWVPIIAKDVDGSNSLPLSLDQQNPNFGRYSACRRIARTIYLGSAPNIRVSNRGLEDRYIKLGCVQPGETAGTFGDALRRLSDQATYLYLDGNRYWISNQPNVTRTAQDRASQYQEEIYKIHAEIIRRLKKDQSRGEFAAIHTAPESSADIPDDPLAGVRLVILHPKNPYLKQSANSKNTSPVGETAQQILQEILDQRGNSPRYYKNTLVFLAPDKTQLENLEKNVAQYLAWDSIVNEKEALNLDAAQNKQADTKRSQSDQDVKTILNQTYSYLLCPEQADPQTSITWKEIRLQPGEDSPILRASRKLTNDDQLLTKYSGGNLSLEVLNRYIWNDDTHHIDLKRLWEYLTQYPYLPRLKNQDVLIEATKEGVSSILINENFAYAEGWDENKQKYIGLVVMRQINPSINSHSLLVKPDIALQQIEAEKLAEANNQVVNTIQESSVPQTISQNKSKSLRSAVNTTSAEQNDNQQKTQPKVFYATVELDPVRINRDIPAIANEIIQHLTRLQSAEVKITLEIEANIPDGVPDDVVRTVTENSRTLKFSKHAFEDE